MGNIEAIGDWRAGLSQTFDYDALDRLTQAVSGAYGTLDFGYDAHGNRQTVGGGSTYTYQPNTPFHLRSINGAYDMVYDANGNLRSGFPGVYSYTPDNLLDVSTMSGTTTRFTYDVDAWRLKKAIDGGTTYYYVRGPNGQLLTEWVNTTPAAVKDYIYAGGRLIAVSTTTAAPK